MSLGFYQNQIVPILTDLAMRQQNLAAHRSRVVPAAEGRVLEIGVGSGRNLPFYSANVRHLIGLDLSPKLLSMARRNSSPNFAPIELIEEGGACSRKHYARGLCSLYPQYASRRGAPGRRTASLGTKKSSRWNYCGNWVGNHSMKKTWYV